MPSHHVFFVSVRELGQTVKVLQYRSWGRDALNIYIYILDIVLGYHEIYIYYVILLFIMFLFLTIFLYMFNGF